MRKFRVGDRVRFELDGEFPEWPRWNYRIDGEPSGKWKEDTVRQVDDGRNHFYLSMPYSWPQPDHPFARYGAPGYLELVEAVEDQGSRPQWVEADVDSHQRGYDAGYENGLRDGKIMVLREQQPPKLVEPRPGFITEVMLQRSWEIQNGAHDLTCDCGACPKIGPRPKDEPTKTVTVEGCVETRHSVPVRSCGTCAWYNVCSTQGARCQSDDFLSWEAGEKLPPKPLPEVEKTTKTVTVDQVAEMVESILMVRAYSYVDFVAKERAHAIAEALVGKTVVKK